MATVREDAAMGRELNDTDPWQHRLQSASALLPPGPAPPLEG